MHKTIQEHIDIVFWYYSKMLPSPKKLSYTISFISCLILSLKNFARSNFVKINNTLFTEWNVLVEISTPFYPFAYQFSLWKVYVAKHGLILIISTKKIGHFLRYFFFYFSSIVNDTGDISEEEKKRFIFCRFGHINFAFTSQTFMLSFPCEDNNQSNDQRPKYWHQHTNTIFKTILTNKIRFSYCCLAWQFRAILKWNEQREIAV